MHRGRTAGYPTAPAQIPACGFSAPGSSEVLASASRLKETPSPLALSAIPRREVGRRVSGPSCPAPVSCAGCEPLSTASPCGRLARPPSTISGSDSRTILGAPRGATYLSFPRNRSGLPSSRRLSSRIPRSSWTPADPREPRPGGSSVVASGTLTPSPSAFRSYGAVSSFRECGLPCGLCGSLCPLQLGRSGSSPPSQLQHSVRVAGWALPGRDSHPARSAKLRLAH